MFDLTKPCSDCPFLKEGGIRLRADRIREIAAFFLEPQGGTFPCHKTVKYTDDDENDDDSRSMRPGEQMCVGGMIFAEKQGRANQMVRINERICNWSPRNLQGFPLVFDSLAAMLKTAILLKRKKKKR